MQRRKGFVFLGGDVGRGGPQRWWRSGRAEGLEKPELEAIAQFANCLDHLLRRVALQCQVICVCGGGGG